MFDFDMNYFKNIYIHELGGRAEIVRIVKIGLSNEIEYDVKLLDGAVINGESELRILQDKFHKEFRVYGVKLVSEEQKENNRKEIIEYLSKVDKLKAEVISFLREENKKLKVVNEYLMKHIAKE